MANRTPTRTYSGSVDRAGGPPEHAAPVGVIADQLGSDPKRGLSEARAAAAVEHPNVLPIFSAGSEDDVLYIVMRYVDGPDLRSLIRENGPLAPERAAGRTARRPHERGCGGERGRSACGS